VIRNLEIFNIFRNFLSILCLDTVGVAECLVANPRQTFAVKTENQEPSSPVPEIEAESTEREETQQQAYVPTEDYETQREETQQQEDESTRHYPT